MEFLEYFCFFKILLTMNNLYPILITSIAGFSTVLGNILLLIDLKYKDKLISFSLGLSFIIMFLISVLELIPEGVRLISVSFNFFSLFCICLGLLFAGYFIVILIDKNIDSDDSLYKVGVLSMISLLIHNIPEGMICAITSSTNVELGLKMSFIILVHNIPEGICISLPIYYATKSKIKAIMYTVISGMGEVLGAILTMVFLKRFINVYTLAIILIITAGIMITLSVRKILKEGLSFKKYTWFVCGIVIGIIVLIFTL